MIIPYWLPYAFLGLFLLMVALEAALARGRLIHARYTVKDTAASLGMTVGNLIMSVATGGMVFAALSFAYQARLLPISRHSAWAWAALILLDDFAYYWFHRIAHECRWWWAAHVNHHSSQQYNLSTALRQTWTGVLVGTWMPWIPLAVVGFPPEMILVQQTFNLFYQFWIHTEAVRKLPAWFEFIFNTPSHHRVHHATNARYLDRNYAGMFIVWDRLFGAFSEERDSDPPQYGIVRNLDTYNPVRIAFHEWVAMARDAAGAKSMRELALVIFGPPGWRADGSGHTTKQIRARGRA